MPSDLISKRTRNEFRETLVGWTLREIDIEFENEGFGPDLNYSPALTGQRRSLVEQYYKKIDFTNPNQVRRLLRVFESVIIALEPHGPDLAARLRSCLERDGFSFEGRRLVIRRPLARFHDLRAAADELNSADILAHAERIEAAIDTDPALAVGSAKELLETTCKTILVARGARIDKSDDIPQLMRKTIKALNLLPDDIPERARGVETTARWAT